MISDEEAQKLKERIRELEEENEMLKEESEKMKRLLTFYQSPNLPSSKQLLKKKEEQKELKKVGAPKGHKGATRKIPTPTKTKYFALKNCPICGNKICSVEKLTRIIEEISSPQKVEVTKNILETGVCIKCGNVVAKSDLPQEGGLGKNLLTHITLLKFEDRLPLRKVVRSLERQHNIHLTHTTILDATKRVSDSLKNSYNYVVDSIKKSEYVHIDQTDMKVGKVTYQLWVFVTATSTLFLIRKAGYKNVMIEILGKKYEGIIIGDGLETYRQYSDKIQRCWAHLLRESKKLADDNESAKPLHEALKKLFEKVNNVKIEDPPQKRQKLYEQCILEMKQWIQQINTYKELRKFATKLENGLTHWFTKILHPYVDATNNKAERALREIIVQRKIFGALRNQKGTEIIETTMTMLTTWKQQGKNTFTELKNSI
jgi:transposase